MFKGKTILVAGGAGFVGSNLIKSLLHDDCRIIATFHKQTPQIHHDNIDYRQCDLCNPEHCRQIVEGVNYVFMCAANTSGAAVIAETPLVHVTPNVIMNTLMLEAAYQAKVDKFLFISSNTVYPFVDHAVKESEGLSNDVYEKYYCVGWMKRFSEILCNMYADQISQPMTTLVVRPANLYGPYDDFDLKTAHVIPALINKIVSRKSPFEIWGDGLEQKDVLFIDDFIDGIRSMMAHCTVSTTLNMGSGECVSINDIAQLLLALDDYHDAEVTHNLQQVTMIPKRLLDCSLAKEKIAFKVSHSLRRGLQETLGWYRGKLLGEAL